MNEQLRQHNAITEARYEMSALEKNIVYMLMREISQDDPDGMEYVIDISEIEKVVGSLDKKEVREATSNLLQRAYSIRRANGDILIVSLMTVVRYDMAANKLLVKISKKILPYFVALKNNYTKFALNIALKLKHKYSKRLYEMLSQHKEVGEFRVSIKELKWRLGLIDEEKQQEKYIHFNALKQRVLEPAQEELAEGANISFSYEATKTGKKYTELTFKIHPTSSRVFSMRGVQATIAFPMAAHTKASKAYVCY